MENTSSRNREDIIEIDLQELAMVLLHKAWLLILATVVTGLIGFLVSAFVITPTYESETSIYILNKGDSDSVTYSDTQLASQLTKDYEQLISGRSVLEKVIEDMELGMSYNQLRNKVVVSNVANTRIIEIMVTDEDPEAAQEIANAVREAATIHIKKVTNVEAVNVVDEANLPVSPADPSITKWTAVAAMIGLFLSAAIVIMVHLLDDSITTEEDVMKYLGLSTLAMIPDIELEQTTSKKKKPSEKKRDE